MNKFVSAAASFTVFHADHGVSESVVRTLVTASVTGEGFFLFTSILPAGVPDVGNALHGPVCGDPPVPEEEVFYRSRSADRPPSRLCGRPRRPTRRVTVIGLVKSPEEVLVFTAYGGPPALREPGDPTVEHEEEKAASAVFWKEHALSA